MCQPLPGPRCAGNIKDQMVAVQARRDEDMRRFVTDPSYQQDRSLNAEMARLQDEYDETRTGQNELRAQIADLEANQDTTSVARDPWSGEPIPATGNQAEIAALRRRLHDATERRAAKAAALKSSQAGNVRAAQFQLRYGAHAGWLHASTLPAEVDRDHGGQITVRPGYAVATTFVDARDESDDFQGRSAWVQDIDVAYETPLRPGPRPGTWITGDPDRGLGDATPYLYDENTQTLTEYAPGSVNLDDPAYHTPPSRPLPAARTIALNAITDLGVLDRNDSLNEHTGYRQARTVEVSEVTSSLRGTGTDRILRVEAHITAVAAGDRE